MSETETSESPTGSSVADDIEIVRDALFYGLEYWGHELDDVSAVILAITPEAKRYESAIEAFEHIVSDQGTRQQR